MKHLHLAGRGRGEALAQAVKVIRSGGIVLYPTDTVYGLGCDPFCDTAVRRLSELKQRRNRRPYLVLVESAGSVAELAGSIPESFYFLSGLLWPGPITMIFEKDPAEPPFAGDDSIGIRCPRCDFLREFLRLLCGPLVSTSANLSGEEPVQDPEESSRQFAQGVDLFLDAGRLPDSPPSTVVDLRHDPPQILRQGAMLKDVQGAIRQWEQKKR
ncbi:MAG: threonylcarbamoyl-AMP synthase [Acidobacteria bacterium]|nr:threonylcarbamoyl-AMP synthase [Acidobacteriota bacterium]